MDTKARAEVNGLAIASLIIGIFSVLFSWTMVITIPGALLAFMFAMLSRGDKKKCGVANAGMILGFTSFGLAVLFFVLFYSLLRELFYSFSFYKNLFNVILDIMLRYGNGGY